MTTKARRFCCTVNYKDGEANKEKFMVAVQNEVDSGAIKYVLVGKEVAPTTGTKHLQCYVHFKSQRIAKALNKKFGGHWTACNGDEQSNYNYCSKESIYYEAGEPSKQGKRTDIRGVYEIVGAGGSMHEVIEEHEGSYQALRHAELLMKYSSPSRSKVYGDDFKPEVVWIWGRPGSGKTRWAVHKMRELYGDDWWMMSNNFQWWEGYQRQPGVILDELRCDSCKFTQLLGWLDRYDTRVPIKGSSCQLMAKTIFVTCYEDPMSLYERGDENIEQLLRRIDAIINIESGWPNETIQDLIREESKSEVGGNNKPLPDLDCLSDEDDV